MVDKSMVSMHTFEVVKCTVVMEEKILRKYIPKYLAIKSHAVSPSTDSEKSTDAENFFQNQPPLILKKNIYVCVFLVLLVFLQCFVSLKLFPNFKNVLMRLN